MLTQIGRYAKTIAAFLTAVLGTTAITILPTEIREWTVLAAVTLSTLAVYLVPNTTPGIPTNDTIGSQ